MEYKEKNGTLYLCDPQKNTKCKKSNCKETGGCFLTKNKKFAVTDSEGMPIKVCIPEIDDYRR